MLPSYWCGTKSKKASEGGATNVDGIVVDDVRKKYGDFEALKGVSMHMERGEVTALLGRFVFVRGKSFLLPLNEPFI